MLDILIWNLMLTAALAGLLLLNGRFQRIRCRPSILHVLWLLVLVKLVTPPIFHVPLLPHNEGESLSEPLAEQDALVLSDLQPIETFEPAMSSPLVGQDPSAGSLVLPWSQSDRWTTVALLGWTLGTVVLCILYARNYYRSRRWLRRDSRADQRLQDYCEAVAKQMGITTPVESRVIGASTSPMLWGLRTPRILVSQETMRQLDERQLRAVIAHELAHFRRRDAWTNSFALVVKTLMWWNPIAWIAHREMRFAQELCCDAIAIGLGNRRDYAQTLLRTIDGIGNPPQREASPFALSIRPVKPIVRRFEMIADDRLTHQLPGVSIPFVIALATGLMCLPVARAVPQQSDDSPPVLVDPSQSLTQPPERPDENATEPLLISADPDLLFFSAKVKSNSTRSPEQGQMTVIHLRDVKREKSIVVEIGDVIQIGNSRLKLLSIGDDSAKLSDGDSAINWAMGQNLNQARKSSEKATAKKRDTEPVQVQVEQVGDQLIIRGAKASVESVTKLIESLHKQNEDDEKKQSNPKDNKLLQVYITDPLDPELLLRVLQTFFKDEAQLRMDVDVKTGRLIVMASQAVHKQIQQLLQELVRSANSATPDLAASSSGHLQFSFRNVPWMDVLSWYAEATGASLVVDQPIPGTMSYKNEKRMTSAEALDLLNALLLTRDRAVVRKDQLLFLVDISNGVPASLAPQIKPSELARCGKYQFVTVLFPMGSRDLDAMQKEVAPLLSKGGKAIALQQSSSLLITDRGEILRRIQQLLESE